MAFCLLFISCRKNTYTPDLNPGYTSVTIKQVVIKALPLYKNWDAGTGPDVAFRVFNPMQQMIASTGVTNDVWSGMLPLKYDFGYGIQIPADQFAGYFYLQFYDDDVTYTEDMATIYLRFDSFHWQDVVTLSSNGVTIELHLTWTK